MQWSSPAYLWLALCLFPVWLGYRTWQRRCRASVAAVAGASRPGRRARRPGQTGWPSGPTLVLLRGALCAAAVLLLTASLCGPRWGAVSENRVSRGADIIVALDTSRSMLADDLAPTRLAAAKEAVARMVAGLQGERVGLVAFAGSAFLVCPLTSDYGAFAAALAETGPGSMPLGGSSLAAPLDEALRCFGPRRDAGRVLVLVSDGEDHGGDLQRPLARLKSAGVAIYCLAAGTRAGSLIPVSGGGYLVDRAGAAVQTRLQLAPLRQIAAAGGGATFELAAGPSVLADLYRREAARWVPVERRTPVSLPRERFQLPLALALLLLAVEPLVPRSKRP